MMDTLEEKKVFPCKPATEEELLRIFDGISYGNSDSCKHFRQVTCKIREDQIPWDSVHMLGILGNTFDRCNEALEEAGLEPGLYVNREGGSLFLIHPEESGIQSCLDRCGKSLRSLGLYNTALSSLDVSSLTALEQLHIENDQELSDIQGLAQLSYLTNLSISYCDSFTQAPGLEKLTQLTSLELSCCQNLQELPPLDQLKQLTSLNLSWCESLRELPPLDQLSQLTSLNLSYCKGLHKLPPLDQLSQLTELNLSGCQNLQELPPLDQLKQLTTLDLSDCPSLHKLPLLDHLNQLTTLDLSYCSSLHKLPLLDHLNQLTTLDLSYCSSLHELPPLDQLKQLTTLDLANCSNLCELPSMDHLLQLTELNLFGCGIRELPEGLRSLSSLRRLELRNLTLRTLPDWLPEIAERFSFKEYAGYYGKNKAIVYLHGTTVEDMPDMSIFDQPYEVVAEWFENRKRGRVRPLNEIKVVFLGDGEAGKSHTIARLMNDGGAPKDYTDQSTPGIVIRNKEYDLGDRKITVHYWDFGGQEIMHSMHRIFLTGRTMYVILLNARDDTQSDRAKYWLHNVKSFAPNAPVLLVLNKIDQNENASVDERDLRGRYDKLTQVVRLSARDFTQEEFNDRFTKILLDEIQKTGFLDAQWPIAWTQVKERLEKMKSHYIMGGDYQALCQECKVDDNQKNLLHWFNDLGVSFCCDGEDDYTLEDYVILRPDWITNALYIILFNALEGARNGLIPHKSIYNLLKNACNNPAIRCTLPQARYTSGDIDYVLRIMRKFNLSFADGSDNEFIPMLCQQNSMVDIQYYQKDAEILEFNMEFDYLPNNLLHRLMVERNGELDMDNVWRTGARFVLKELGYSAVVVIDSDTLRFFIRHTDPMHRPNTYLTMLKAHVDRIVAKMGLQPPKCQLIYKLDDGRRAEFGYDRLLKLRKRGRMEEYCEALDEDFLIEDIMNQSAPDGLVDEKKLLDAIKHSCRNIQGDMIYRASTEDTRNRRIRDDLFGWGYNILDQSQRGLSGTGRGIGELDLLLFNEAREPWTIIEALRVPSFAKTDWNSHLDKLLGNYNYFGAPFSYLLTYVDTAPEKFNRIWEDFQTHIKAYAPDGFTCLENSFADLTDSTDSKFIKTAKCQYDCGGRSTTACHIFVRIPRQGEIIS